MHCTEYGPNSMKYETTHKLQQQQQQRRWRQTIIKHKNKYILRQRRRQRERTKMCSRCTKLPFLFLLQNSIHIILNQNFMIRFLLFFCSVFFCLRFSCGFFSGHEYWIWRFGLVTSFSLNFYALVEKNKTRKNTKNDNKKNPRKIDVHRP